MLLISNILTIIGLSITGLALIITITKLLIWFSLKNINTILAGIEKDIKDFNLNINNIKTKIDAVEKEIFNRIENIADQNRDFRITNEEKLGKVFTKMAEDYVSKHDLDRLLPMLKTTLPKGRVNENIMCRD